MKRTVYTQGIIFGIIFIAAGLILGKDPVHAQTPISREYFTFHNLVRNGSFESFDQTEGLPAEWGITDPSQVSLLSDPLQVKVGAVTVKLSGPVILTQDIRDWKGLEASNVTLGAWIKGSSGDSLKFYVDDGVNRQEKAVSLTDTQWKFVTFKPTTAVSGSAKYLKIELEILSTATGISLDGVMLTQVSKGVVFVPNPDDQERSPQDLIYTDGVNGYVGIGTSAPQKELDVAGEIRASGKIYTGEEEILTRSLADSKYLNANQSDLMEGTLTIDGSLDVSDEIKEDGAKVLTEPTADSRYVDLKGGDTILGDLIVNGLLTSSSGKILQDVEVGGLVKANRFEGDGSGLTNILSQWKSSTDGTGIYFDSGNVGIGTASPTNKLDVAGTLNADSYQSSSSNVETVSGQYGKTKMVYSFSEARGLGYNQADDRIYFAMSETVPMVVDNAGSVGIGTTDPSVKLDVQGSAPSIRLKSTDATSVNLTLDGNTASGDNTQIQFNRGGSAKAFIGTRYSTAPSDGLFFYVNSSDRMVIQSDGNVGIGTVSPTNKLDVGGSGTASSALAKIGGSLKTIALHLGGGSVFSLTADEYATALRFNGLDVVWGDMSYYPNGGDAGEQGHFRFSLTGSTVDTIPDAKIGVGSLYVAGNVGIGTTSPQRKLEIQDSAPIRFTGSATDFLELVQTTTNEWTWRGQPGNNILSMNQSTGNIGLGAPSRSDKKLYVAGDIYLDGNINAKYQDVAEWVASSEKLTPGTVVVIDGKENNQVVASTKPNDTKIAGVVSTKPGLILGDGGDGQYMIAHTGRVKVKVDAGFGAIHKGDLLTTSSKQGVAMKARPKMLDGEPFFRPGTILGKALESLEDGQGEILVLLSLQ